MVDQDPIRLSPYERLKFRFESLPQGEGTHTKDFREIILGDGTEVWLDVDKSDEQPELALGATVITSAQIEAADRSGNVPEFFRFVISQSGKRSYMVIPKPQLTVGDITLDNPLALNRTDIPFTDPAVSEILLEWLDEMIDQEKHLLPPIQVSFPRSITEPNS